MSAIILLMSSPALAATITVNPSGGADYTSLSTAIAAASTGDTLELATGTYTGPFDTDGKRLTINGNGPLRSILTAGATKTVFTVENGETVTLSDLSLDSALQGLEVRGSNVTLDNVHVTDHAGRTPGSGAGVYEGASLTVIGCEFARNTATATYSGGGIYASDSTVTVSNSEFRDNSAGQGGGMYFDHSTVDLTDVTLEGNIASTYGGGIRIRYASVLEATRLAVQDNVAGGRGGGISAYQADLTIAGGTFTGNQTGTAGGALHIDQTTGGTVVVDADITDNVAVSTGGGIHAASITLELSGTLADNVAGEESFGGGLYAVSTDAVVADATIARNYAGTGGGIYGFFGGSLTIDDTTVEANESVLDGGGVYAATVLTLSESTVVGNIAGANGGGLAVVDATAQIIRSQVDQNTAQDAGGGYFVNDSDLTFVGASPITANAAQFGAGIAATGSRSEQVDFGGGQVIENNTASGEGGGVFLSELSSVVLDGCTFSTNDGRGAGGGARLAEVTRLSANNVLVTANQAEYGAGFHLTGIRSGSIAHSIFSENIATAAGGGILAQNPDGPTPLTHLQFIENTAAEGAALYLFNDVEGLHPLSFSDIAASTGPAVSIRVSPGASVHHVSAAHNTGVAFETDSSTAAGITLEWNNTWDNTDNYGGLLPNLVGTDGNIAVDPDYASVVQDGNADNDLLIPGSNSQMRNQGNPALLNLDGTTADPGHLGGPDAADQDYDEDGFFISQGDCDDAADATHPGAAERWYDGEDNDCAGGDDFDADGDGFQVSDDCDDSDPTINPASTDDTVDGVDQDCDDRDGPFDPDTDDEPDQNEDDDDLDGDGVPQSEDCDDADASAFPGNTEQCNDRVDNDCDGFIDDYDNDCVGKASGRACSSLGTQGSSTWLALLLMLGLARRRQA